MDKETSLIGNVRSGYVWFAVSVFLSQLIYLHRFGHFTDFQIYYEAGLKSVAHQTVFDVQGRQQFKYSPLIAWVYGVFFGPMPMATASRVHL